MPGGKGHWEPSWKLALVSLIFLKTSLIFPILLFSEGEERSESGGKKADSSSRFTQDAPVLEPRVLHPSDHPLQSGQTRTALPFQGSQLALLPWLDQDFQSRAGPPTPRVQGMQLTSDIRAVCDLFY